MKPSLKLFRAMLLLPLSLAAMDLAMICSSTPSRATPAAVAAVPAQGTDKYVIIFYARKGYGDWVVTTNIGHTFVGLGRVSADGTLKLAALGGLYPEKSAGIVSKLVSGGDGAVAYDPVLDGTPDIQQKYYLDKAHYDAAKALFDRETAAPPEYAVASGDHCVYFVSLIAKAADIKVPASANLTTPFSYVQHLVEANGQDPTRGNPEFAVKPAIQPSQTSGGSSGEGPNPGDGEAWSRSGIGGNVNIGEGGSLGGFGSSRKTCETTNDPHKIIVCATYPR